MIRNMKFFAVSCCAWLATVAPTTSQANDVSGPGSSNDSSGKPDVREDPCAGYELGSIQGLRGTIISRVFPATFSEGDQVTICGRGLSMVRFVENYQPKASGPLEAGNFIEIGDENYKLGLKLQVFAPAKTASGDRITFIAGGPFEVVYQPVNGASTPGEKAYSLVPVERHIARGAANGLRGELRLSLTPSGYAPPKVSGPVVTWLAGGPKVNRAYGRFFSKQEPFVITPRNASQAISPDLGLVVIEGGNLRDAEARIGDAKLVPYHMPGEDGTSLLVTVPAGAMTGMICVFGQGDTRCGPNMSVQPGPNITKTPQLPLNVRTTYVIEGRDLKPNIPGLSYRLVLSGLNGDVHCGQVLNVIEHTNQKIVFSLGDPNDKTALDSACFGAVNYQTPQQNPSNVMFLMARYKNNDQPLFRQFYFLAPPPS